MKVCNFNWNPLKYEISHKNKRKCLFIVDSHFEKDLNFELSIIIYCARYF